MIETRTIILDRVEKDEARNVCFYCGTDGSAYFVSWTDACRAMRASGHGLGPVYIKGARCTFELVEGRWTLARVELAR